MNENSRDIYNRFGSDKLEFDPRLDDMMLFVDIFTVYLFWAILVYAFTIPQSSRACRSWIAMCGVAMIAVEGVLSITDSILPELLKTTIFATATEYELILFLHSVFPIIIVGLIFLSEGMYFDLNMFVIYFL